MWWRRWRKWRHDWRCSPRASRFEALVAIVSDMRCAAENSDARATSAASVEFHRLIVTAAHNELLLQTWESLQIDRRTAAAVVAADLDLTAVADEHDEMLAVSRRSDDEAACRDARDHQVEFADLPHDAQGRPKAPTAGSAAC